MQAVKNQGTIVAIPEERIATAEELNLRIQPENTYLFDGLSLAEMEGILNNMTFYHELVFGVPLNKFLSESVLSQVFVPVATFNEDKKNQEDEIVAMIEGAHFPIFGSAVSLEKIQFNDDLTIEDDIDHSKVAIRMA